MARTLPPAVYEKSAGCKINGMSPSAKACFGTGVFSLIGLWALMYRAPQTPELLPHVIFYVVLLINTFFSLRFFAPIQPVNTSQTIIDAACVGAYIAMALSIGFPVAFALSALALFIASPAKYALMLALLPHTAMLRRKILINLLGATASAVLLGITLLGYPLQGAWAFTIAFALANLYLLLINPMYRL